MFNPKRLALARMRRRLTCKALAEKSHLTADTISRLEHGKHDPEPETVSQLSVALHYPNEFFYAGDPEDISIDAVSFRSFSRMSARERDAAIAAGSLGLELVEWAEDRFSLPEPNLLDLSYERDPKLAASTLRQYWGIGDRPIGNLIGLMEVNGVRVLSLSENTASVNAFSFWRDNKPFIFLNNFKSAESSIFDLGHELGHLLIHRKDDPKKIKDCERDADSFSAHFLMPENDVRSRVGKYISVENILVLKKRWKVSAMAFTFQLKTLGLISESRYRSICMELSKRGYRRKELDGVDREKSVVWKKIFDQLWSERVSKNDIAKDLKVPVDELEGLVWNLAGQFSRPEKDKINPLHLV